MMIFFVIGVIVLSTIGWIIQMVVFTKRSMGKKNLPTIKTGPNTLTVPTYPSDYCPRCGKFFGNGNFCSTCGSPKLPMECWEIPIEGRMRSTDFERCFNNWLAENPYVTDLKLHLETKTSMGAIIHSKKVMVERAYIEYRVDSVPHNYQYGIAFVYKCRLFANLGYNYEKLFYDWNVNNMDCSIISTHSTGKFIHWGNSNYTEYHSFILFKKQLA